AVQIGEPITQKKMADFLLEARDAGLYKGITDNGAGGLSSSLGEMARDAGGGRIDLDGCPLKYEGLAAWEILVSESQERMSLAVDPERLDALLALARRRGVVASAVGEFTASGQIEVTHGGKTVGLLGLDFVHDGPPQMVIPARWPAAGAAARPRAEATPGPDGLAEGAGAPTPAAAHDRLLALLRDPNVGSKEHLVRQYDHEVQGGSVVKPHCGRLADAPTDGAVIRPRLDSWRGVTVTHGICPRRGDADTYDMAVAAVDEAVRAHVALGGDPERMAALDNFCWPDPVLSDATPDGPYKMAQLVRACRGLADACTAYRLPLVSGKDSMKNDANLGGRKVSIRPTLLVSLTGIVADVREAMTTDFKRPGDRILVVGDAAGSDGAAPGATSSGPLDPAAAPAVLAHRFELYRRLHTAIARGLCTAVHDLADGGLAVALAECAVGGRLGARVDVGRLTSAGAQPGEHGASARAHAALFVERDASFVVTCDPASLAELARVLGDARWADAGEVVADPALVLTEGEFEVRWTLDELVDAWKAFARRQGASIEPSTVDEVAATERPARDRATVSSRGARWLAAPTALILTGYGINADRELAAAFAFAGARTEGVHLSDLLADRGRLDRAGILAVPGGFSYGDHVGSGRMLAHRLEELRPRLDAFRRDGGLVLGICNGFQVLVKLGMLPDLAGRFAQEVSLVHNDSGLFDDSWVTIEFDPGCDSPWLIGLDRLDVPIRHGEGRFVTRDAAVFDELGARRLVAARYANRNPNGSQGSIAGIVDTTGNVLGMMPHPEAYLIAQNHPHWRDRRVDPDGGLALFRNAVHAAR
ncbi:MAG: phosphoribosylformylglycinamidine synthase subunit PurQ, partial [Spirochaetota bacterium]